MKQDYKNDAERIYFEWDKALSSNDISALLSLYAEDTIIESPLIPHLSTTGICKGKQELRTLLRNKKVLPVPISSAGKFNYVGIP